MNEINYEHEDFSSFVLIDDSFKKRFNLISIAKNGQNRAAFIVNDIVNDRICFLKAKLLHKTVKNELEVYKLLKNNPHENIVQIYDIIVTDKMYFVVEKYMSGVNLGEYGSVSSIKELDNIIKYLSNGLNHIHKLNIIHGDVKLENVMISDDCVKIVDFDLARVTNDNYILVEHMYGTENYIAPESFDLNMYSKKTDLWSLGVLLYKLITNKFPYINRPNKMHHFYIKNHFKNLDIHELDKYRNVYGNNIINIITRLLEFNDSKRAIIEIAR